MNVMGATAVEIPNGESPPAITVLPGIRCALAAKPLTSARYQSSTPALADRLTTLFGSFHACQYRTRGSP